MNLLPIKLREKGFVPLPHKQMIADDGSRVLYADGSRGISYAPKKWGGKPKKTLR